MTIQIKNNLHDIAKLIRDDFISGRKDFVVLYAYNGTGKTLLSMEFKELGKKDGSRDTLYFNAFTEDLFSWHNDLDGDTERYLKINSESSFFAGLKELALEERIGKYFHRYTDVDFKIDYETWAIHFSTLRFETFEKRKENTEKLENDNYTRELRKKYIASSNEKHPVEIVASETDTQIIKVGDKAIEDFWGKQNIKISRGEENIFIWCMFLALCELAIDEDDSYSWVKYIYIDDPISSLDENNAVMVAVDLITLLKKSQGKIKCVISTHHTLFFNVLCNEVTKSKKYFLSHVKEEGKYHLRTTCDTPFFHHIATITDLKKAVTSGTLHTYHFNILRSLLEKAANFHGYAHFSACLKKDESDPDEALFHRMLQLLSHGGYSIFEPREMMPENKKHFENILNHFLEHFPFNKELFEEVEQVESQ